MLAVRGLPRSWLALLRVGLTEHVYVDVNVVVDGFASLMRHVKVHGMAKVLYVILLGVTYLSHLTLAELLCMLLHHNTHPLDDSRPYTCPWGREEPSTLGWRLVHVRYLSKTVERLTGVPHMSLLGIHK